MADETHVKKEVARINTKYINAAVGMVKRLNQKDLLAILLAEAKKELVLQYVLDGTMPNKPTAVQIITRLELGTSYTHGPKDERVTIDIPANAELAEELFSQVPEEEYVVPTNNLAANAEAKMKKALVGSIMALHKAQLPAEVIANTPGIEGLFTVEEIIEITNPAEEVVEEVVTEDTNEESVQF